MYNLKIHRSKRDEIIQWCSDNIGERKYYLHTQVGGADWNLRNNFISGYYELQIECESSMISFLALKFGTE